MNVVALSPGPKLDDVAGMLRALADAIEAGEHGELKRCIVVCDRDDDGWPDVFGYGDASARDAIASLEIAKGWFVTQVVQR